MYVRIYIDGVRLSDREKRIVTALPPVEFVPFLQAMREWEK